MKKITLLFGFVACALLGNAQTLLTEDFNYPIGSDIKSQGWTIHSGSGPTKDSILVVEGLTFEKYSGSGIGGAAGVTGGYCDHNHTFASQTSGTTYAAFMLKAQAAGSAPTYFLHFGPSTIGTTFFSRVWINQSATGLGLGDSAPSTFSPILAGQTYLIVIKYDFATKTTSLYTFENFPSNEPANAQATFLETKGPAAITPTDLGSIALRQSQTSKVSQQNVIVDGVRVATSWSGLFSTSALFNPSAEKLSFSISGNTLTITNAPASTVDVFNTVGVKVRSLKLENGSADLDLSKGLYIVRVGNQSAKIRL